MAILNNCDVSMAIFNNCYISVAIIKNCDKIKAILNKVTKKIGSFCYKYMAIFNNFKQKQK